MKIPALQTIIAQRRRRSLLAFVEATASNYETGWIHKEICEKLEKFIADLTAGRRPRLLLTVPPRHGKSQIASRALPAFFLGHYPQKEVMLVSYSAELANSFSYDARAIVSTPWYQEAFPEAMLESDRKGITRWRMQAGGGLNPCGIGGSITGAGGDLIILDDLFKSEQQAHSAQYRQLVHDRYRSSIYTRLSPNSGVIFLTTRWHHDDLAGRLLELSDNDQGDKWEVVSYPAIAVKDEKHRKKGEALHPARYSLEQLRQIEKVTDPGEWAALYQQTPIAVGGEFFQRRWVKYWDPGQFGRGHIWDHVVISVDSAYKTKIRADRTAIQVWGKFEGSVYLIESWTGRVDFAGLCDQVAAFCRAWCYDSIAAKKIETVIESKANGMALIRYLKNVDGVAGLRPFDPQQLGGKEVRANIASAWFRAGRVYVPQPDFRLRPQIVDTMNEWFKFPTGKHDDGVDAMTQAICHLRAAASTAARAVIGRRPTDRGPAW